MRNGRTFFIIALICTFSVPSGHSAFGMTLTFQQDVNGYMGTQDTWLDEHNPSTMHGDEPLIQVDDDTIDSPITDTGVRSQGLLTFRYITDKFIYEGDNISNLTRIPRQSIVQSAKLSLYCENPSSEVPFAHIHHMIHGWGEGTTWYGMDSGVQTNDREASSTIYGTLASNSGWQEYDITSIAQLWVDESGVNGDLNYGVLLDATTKGADDDGLGFCSSENPTVSHRPKLEVNFTPKVYEKGPTIDDVSLSSTTISEGESVTVTVRGADPSITGANRGSVDTVIFFVNGKNIGSCVGSGSQSATITYSHSGVFDVMGQVRDSDGVWSVPRNIQLTVLNVAPTLTSLTSDMTVSPGELFTVSANATDPGQGYLSFAWDFDGDGEFNDGIYESGMWAFEQAGKHLIHVQVSDGDGGFDTGTITITVVPEPSMVLLVGSILPFIRRRCQKRDEVDDF